VPGAIDELEDVDRQGLALIGTDDEAAARWFAAGFEPMAGLPHADDETIRSTMRQMLSTDEAMRLGTDGCAWDNVAWVGPWATDLSAVTAPTWLWYGSVDPLGPVSHGEWLLERLPNAALVVRPGEGHLGIFTHWDEIASTLAATSR